MPFSVSVGFLIMCLTTCLALSGHALAQSSPWPVPGHDAGNTFTAADDVPVFAYYSASTISLIAPELDYQFLVIPAPGIYVGWNLSTVFVYNRAQQSTFTFNMLLFAEPIATSGSSMRLYYVLKNYEVPHDSFGAYSLETGKLLWSERADVEACTWKYNSFADAFDIILPPTSISPANLTRYSGATGKQLWSRDLMTIYGVAYENLLRVCPKSGNILTSIGNSRIILRSASDGSVLWNTTFPNAAFGSYLASVDDYVVYSYLTAEYHMQFYAFNSTSGVLLWNSTVLSNKTGCAVAEPLAMLLLDNSTRSRWGVIASCIVDNSELYVLDLSNGKLLYHHTVNGSLSSIVTIYANVYYIAKGGDLYRWNVLTDDASQLYAGTTKLGNLMVDSDGTFVAAPVNGGSVTLIAPHLH